MTLEIRITLNSSGIGAYKITGVAKTQEDFISELSVAWDWDCLLTVVGETRTTVVPARDIQSVSIHDE